eukprot:320036_1
MCICADPPVTKPLLTLDRIQTKCTKAKIISFVVALCIIIAISSIIAVLINRTNNNTQQSIPSSTTATLTVSNDIDDDLAEGTDNINNTHFSDSRYCMDSTECSNQEIIANKIFCFNSETCSHSELISLSQIGSINCISDQACYSSNLLFASGENSKINCFGYKSCSEIANGVKTFGNLYCKSTKSCYNLSPSILAKQVQCSGEQSCASDGINQIVYNVEMMNCSGDWSCSQSIIYAKQIHIYSEMYPIKNSEIIAKNTDILDVYLHNDLSGSFGNIRCKNESICNIYCYSNKACENMNIFIDNNNVTMNIECDEVICPNIWYNNDNFNGIGTNIEFDNTQLFRDNNGFVLNDEMFDIGQNWNSEGDFNLNITFQNFADNNDDKDMKKKRLLDIASLQL